MINMKQEIKKRILIGFLGLVFGWGAHYGYIVLDNYYNRPKLEFKIESLVVSEKIDNNWVMRVAVYHENTGNSESIFNINKCEVSFPQIENEQINIKLNKTYTLPQRSFDYDTINIPIPSFYDDVNLDKFSRLEKIRLNFHELRRDKKYTIERDSTEIEISGKMVLEERKSPKAKDFVTVDKKTGDSLLIRGTYSFFYKDKFYKNYYYPGDAQLDHKIKGDKIIIEYITKANKPFLFIPHKDLKDKVLLANTAVLSGTIQQNTDKGKEFRNFELIKDEDLGNLYFYKFK